MWLNWRIRLLKLSQQQQSRLAGKSSTAFAAKKFSKTLNKSGSAGELMFPPHLEERISNWSKLLKYECKFLNKNRIIKYTGINNVLFKFKSLTHETRGLTLQLETIQPLSAKDVTLLDTEIKHKQPLTFSYYHPGKIQIPFSQTTTINNNNKDLPGSLSEKDLWDVKEFDDSGFLKKEDLISDEKTVAVIFLFREGCTFTFLVSDKKFKLNSNEKMDYEFKALLIPIDLQINKLIELMGERKEWSNMPGYKLMLYAYRARPMPSLFNDKNITLANDFNKEQCEAIKAALNSQRPLITIQGPPGTGKTKVIAEIIIRSIQANQKVICCAGSHKAVQNIMEYCEKRGINNYCNLIRYENKFTIPGQLEEHAYYPKLKFDLSTLNATNWECNPIHYDRELNKATHLKFEMEGAIAKKNSLVFTTLSSSYPDRLISQGFKPDLVIMDEAGQVLECATWPMLLQAPRAVIVGDHNQLAANVLSPQGRESNLNTSLIEWLCKEFPKNINFFLKTQYRSNKLIQEWSNTEFYDGKLVPDFSVTNITLKDLIQDKISCENYGTQEKENFCKDEEYGLFLNDPLILVDTDLIVKDSKNCYKKMFYEKIYQKSFLNYGEAKICAAYLKQLLKTNRLKSCQIGCITPYVSQTAAIKNCIGKDIKDVEISSVDAFQGQQREAIILSFVRNNFAKNLGFLNDYRRLNVAITRAKRQFVMVASSQMLKSDEVLNRLYEVFRTNGKIVSPEVYLKSPSLKNNC